MILCLNNFETVIKTEYNTLHSSLSVYAEEDYLKLYLMPTCNFIPENDRF